MNLNFKKFGYSVLAVIAVFAVVLTVNHFSPSKAEASASDNLSGWAWSENIGWLSFNATNESAPNDYGVRVAASGAMSGYAWSENIGWIKFDGGSFNKSTGAVSGTVKACAGTEGGDCTGGDRTDGWDGTIKLAGTADDGSSYGVKATGCNWGGWAWGSDVVGWIHFSGPGYGVIGTGDACTSSPGLSCNSSNQCVAGGGGASCTKDADCIPGVLLDNGTGNGVGTSPGDSPFFCPSNTVKLNWTYSDPNNSPQSAFEIQIDTNSAFSSPIDIQKTSSSNSYETQTGQLTLGKTYYWRIRVTNSATPSQTSNWSNSASFNTPAACGGAICNNGVKEGTEQCDINDFGSPPATCVSLGYTGGTLKCSASCTFDKSGCTSSGKGSIMIKRIGDTDTVTSAPGGINGTEAGVSSVSVSSPSINTTDNPAIFSDKSPDSYKAYASNVLDKIVKVAVCSGATECFVNTSTIVTPANCSGVWCSYNVNVSDGEITKIVFKYFNPATSTIHEI